VVKLGTPGKDVASEKAHEGKRRGDALNGRLDPRTQVVDRGYPQKRRRLKSYYTGKRKQETYVKSLRHLKGSESGDLQMNQNVCV